MKNPFFALLFILLTANMLSAQNWFENNPQWLNYTTAGFSGDGYEYATITGDTLLGGLQAKIMTRYFDMNWANDLTQLQVVRQSGDSIWSWYQGDYHLIYDFSLQPGDTLATPLAYNANALKRYVIDSVGQVNIGGETLRFQKAHFIYNNQPVYALYPALIIEKIGMVDSRSYNTSTGNTNNLWPHFFFYEPNSGATDGPQWILCRFENDQFVYNASTFCSALTDVSDISGDVGFSVSPNPFDDRFSIQAAAGQSVIRARVFDASGQLRLQTTETQINAGALSAGLYILEITSGKNEKTYLKLIKNR